MPTQGLTYQDYFTQERAKGRSATDIQHDNPFMSREGFQGQVAITDPRNPGILQFGFRDASGKRTELFTPKPQPPIVSSSPQLNKEIAQTSAQQAPAGTAQPLGLSGTPTESPEDAERRRLEAISQEGAEQSLRVKLAGELGGAINAPIFDKFGRAIQDVERERVAERNITAAAAGKQAQSGGFSSAIGTYMQDLEARYNRRREALERARDEALQTGNAQIYELIENRIAREQSEREAKVNRLLDAQARAEERAMKQEEFGMRKQQFLSAEQERQRENLTNQVQQIAQIGGVVPDTLKWQFDMLYGVGFTDRYMQFAQKAAQAKRANSRLIQLKI